MQKEAEDTAAFSQQLLHSVSQKQNEASGSSKPDGAHIRFELSL